MPVILSAAKNLKAFKEILRRFRLLRMTTESFSTVYKSLTLKPLLGLEI